MIGNGEELFRNDRERFHAMMVVFTVAGMVGKCEDRFPALIR
jgi:hypothetical protein